MNIYLYKNKLIKFGVALVLFGSTCLMIIIIREPRNVFRKTFMQIPLLSQLVEERNKTYTLAKYVELREKSPNLEYLIKFIFGVDRSQPEVLKDYLQYYQLISSYFPETAEAYGILGYCYFYLGELEKSKSAFLKAREVNPNQFWFSFNLAMVYLKLNEKEESDFYFNEAGQLDSEGFNKTIDFINRSQIYQQFFSKVEGISGEYFRKNLMAGYQLMINHESMTPSNIELKLF